MTITITEKEYIAITQVLDQVNTDYEAASDENYLKTMGESINLVNNVIDKYRKARYKANTFQQIRAEVSRHNRNRCVLAKDIDKMARKIMKQLKEENKL